MAFFQGRALWMVTVALLVKPSGLIPRERWSDAELKLARRMIREALDGVGVVGTDIESDEQISIATRRLCRDEERLMVPEPYAEARP